MALTLLDLGISATLLISAAGWLTQSIITHRLSKDIENFKTSLREHEIRFSSLHEKRAEVIAELYSHMIDCIESIDLLYPSWAPIRFLQDQKEILKIAYDSSRKLILYFDKNRIYFGEEIVAIIENFAKELREHVFIYELYNIDEESKAKLDDAMKKVKEQIPQAMKVIEAEFRVILGVS